MSHDDAGIERVDAAIGQALAMVVDRSAAAMAMFDRDMRFVAASDAMLRVYGLDRVATIGQVLYETVGALPGRYRSFHRRGLDGEECACEQDLCVRADGSPQWLRWSQSPWRTVAGSVGGLIVSIEDITRTTLLESSLDSADRMLEAVFEMPTVGIAITEIDGRFLRCNRAFQDVVGYLDAELQGMSVGSLMHADDANAALGAMEPVRCGESSFVDLRFRLLRTDARHAWIQAHLCPMAVDLQGRRRLVLFAQDVTERVQLETHVREGDRLASIGMLGAGVGHDLGNMLFALRGAIASLESVIGDEPAASPARSSIRILQEGTSYLQELSESLYLLSAAPPDEAARGEDRPAADLCSWWAGTGELIRRSMPRDVAWSFRPSGGDCWAQIAPSSLAQVLLNLCTNAGHAVEGNASAGRGKACIDISAWPSADGGSVSIRVSDNGVGMTPEVVRRAFDPFFTTRRSSGGSGLGLALVRRLVSAVGGTVRIDSTPGRGTSVTLMLCAALR